MTTTNLPARRSASAPATRTPATSEPTVKRARNQRAERDLSWIGKLAMTACGVLLFATFLGLFTAL